MDSVGESIEGLISAIAVLVTIAFLVQIIGPLLTQDYSAVTILTVENFSSSILLGITGAFIMTVLGIASQR